MASTPQSHGPEGPQSPEPWSEPTPEPTPAPTGRGAARRAAPLVLLLIGAALGWWLLGDALSFDTLRDRREALTAWRDANYGLAVIAYMAAYVAVVAFSLPGALAMTLTGGFLFGLFPGAPMILVAATVGATAIFVAAKTGLGDRLQARLEARGGVMARFRKGVEANAVSFLLLMRLAPVVPFFLANLAPAFLGVRLWTFAWTTFVGIMPGTLVYTWVGSGLGAVFDRGETPDLGLIFEPHILGPLLGLCLLALAPVALKAWRARRAQGVSG